MNEQRINQVLDIERQAREVYEAAKQKADQIPAQAEKEAKASVEKSRSEAEAEAHEIITQAQSGDDSTRIVSEAEKNSRENEVVATTNFDRAVAYVLNRVIGKE